MIPPGSECRNDCCRRHLGASIAADILSARRERPSRVASVGQDPIRPVPVFLPVVDWLEQCARCRVAIGSGFGHSGPHPVRFPRRTTIAAFRSWAYEHSEYSGIARARRFSQSTRLRRSQPPPT